MAGYCGWSMSNNAVDAYDNGEMPLSKWNKEAIINRIEEWIDEEDIKLQCSLDEIKKLSLGVLKEYFLEYSSWHHTGKYYQETKFYSLDECYIETLTDEDLQWLASNYKERQRKLRERKAEETEENEAETEEKWECCCPEWTGTRKHPKKKMIREIGIIKGKWFYRPNGHKKRISAEEFRKIRLIVEDDADAADNT